MCHNNVKDAYIHDKLGGSSELSTHVKSACDTWKSCTKFGIPALEKGSTVVVVALCSRSDQYEEYNATAVGQNGLDYEFSLVLLFVLKSSPH
ncbi:unnamed protein product [Allacma fusca]|uniref:Uncharacterized protein n=1 Tax=Allacma fusca TaxID=39272 RepID=A0A8J2JJX0_9HEXA|nr:unnamed protein product [Allacma fusca]